MSKYRKTDTTDTSRLNPKNIFIYGSALILLIFILFILFYKPPSYNKTNFCPKENINEYGLTAVIVDLSDPLSASQEEALKAEFVSLTKKQNMDTNRNLFIEKGDRLVVYLTNETEKPEKLFDMCSPGTSEERSNIEKMSEAKYIYDNKWRNFSLNILEELSKRFKGREILQSSPIIETLAYVRNKEFLRPQNINNNKTNNIFIVSDMLQNSDLYSMYTNKEDHTKIYNYKPVNLSGINILVLNLINLKYKDHQNAAMQTWWRKYFSHAKGELLLWSRL